MRESDKGKLPYDQTGLSDEMIGMQISAAAGLMEFLPYDHPGRIIPGNVDAVQGESLDDTGVPLDAPTYRAMFRAKMMDELYAARCEVKRISRNIINFDKEV